MNKKLSMPDKSVSCTAFAKLINILKTILCVLGKNPDTIKKISSAYMYKRMKLNRST